MNDLLKDKVILISGGTKGVGRGVAIECARQGARVVIGGRDESSAGEIITEAGNNGNPDTVFFKTDVSDISQCRKLVNSTISKFGRIDGFVNYAGVLPVSSLVDTDEQIYDRVFSINLKAAFFLSKYVIGNMLETGGGSVVLVGSAHAYGGEEDRAPYAVSKGALLTLMKHISKNYMKYSIRSNYITMGWVATPGELALRKQQGRDLNWLRQTAGKHIALGRLLTVEDHVPGIIYLLSDMSTAVTGTELKITGGFDA